MLFFGIERELCATRTLTSSTCASLSLRGMKFRSSASSVSMRGSRSRAKCERAAPWTRGAKAGDRPNLRRMRGSQIFASCVTPEPLCEHVRACFIPQTRPNLALLVSPAFLHRTQQYSSLHPCLSLRLVDALLVFIRLRSLSLSEPYSCDTRR